MTVQFAHHAFREELAENVEPQVTIHSYYYTVLKRRWIVLAVALAIWLVAAILAFVQTPDLQIDCVDSSRWYAHQPDTGRDHRRWSGEFCRSLRNPREDPSQSRSRSRRCRGARALEAPVFPRLYRSIGHRGPRQSSQDGGEQTTRRDGGGTHPADPPDRGQLLDTGSQTERAPCEYVVTAVHPLQRRGGVWLGAEHFHFHPGASRRAPWPYSREGESPSRIQSERGNRDGGVDG